MDVRKQRKARCVRLRKGLGVGFRAAGRSIIEPLDILGRSSCAHGSMRHKSVFAVSRTQIAAPPLSASAQQYPSNSSSWHTCPFIDHYDESPGFLRSRPTSPDKAHKVIHRIRGYFIRPNARFATSICRSLASTANAPGNGTAIRATKRQKSTLRRCFRATSRNRHRSNDHISCPE